MREASCLVCGGVNSPSGIEGLLKCKGCSFVTADSAMSSDELKNLYVKNYFFGEEYKDYIADKKAIQKNFSSRLKTLLEYVADSKDKKLFEIGAAYGFFLELAKEKFNRVNGVDVSLDATSRSGEVSGVEVLCSDFLDYDIDRSYDIFCMWDTIEHIESPHLYLEKIANVIKHDGLIAITTNDIDSINAKIRKSKWRQIHPPTHLHYFSAKTLTRLLEKYGFEVVHVSHPGFYRSLENIAHILFVKKYKLPFLYSAIKRSGLLRLCLYSNFYDIMYVIGRKK